MLLQILSILQTLRDLSQSDIRNCCVETWYQLTKLLRLVLDIPVSVRLVAP